MARFPHGYGHEKVLAGEFELLNTLDGTQTYCSTNFQNPRPRMSIAMAVIIGQYGLQWSKIFPKTGCNSKVFTEIVSSDRVL